VYAHAFLGKIISHLGNLCNLQLTGGILQNSLFQVMSSEFYSAVDIQKNKITFLVQYGKLCVECKGGFFAWVQAARLPND